MIEINKPIEDLTLVEVNRHLAQCGVLLTERDIDLTNVVDVMLRLKDRKAELLRADY